MSRRSASVVFELQVRIIAVSIHVWWPRAQQGAYLAQWAVRRKCSDEDEDVWLHGMVKTRFSHEERGSVFSVFRCPVTSQAKLPPGAAHGM